MGSSIFNMSVSELRTMFKKELDLFIAALESGARWEELQVRKDNLRNLSMMIDEKTPQSECRDKGRGPGKP